MSEKLIIWCQTHDWGRDAYAEGEFVLGLQAVSVDRDGQVTKEIVALPADFRAIRNWAGY